MKLKNALFYFHMHCQQGPKYHLLQPSDWWHDEILYKGNRESGLAFLYIYVGNTGNWCTVVKMVQKPYCISYLGIKCSLRLSAMVVSLLKYSINLCANWRTIRCPSQQTCIITCIPSLHHYEWTCMELCIDLLAFIYLVQWLQMCTACQTANCTWTYDL